jgi:hypothetical protein
MMIVYGPSNAVSLEVPTDACTGIAASWCPIHGDCTCPKEASGEPIRDILGGRIQVRHDPECPLHCAGTTHATTLHGGMNEVPKAFTSGIVKDWRGYEWAGWVFWLDFGNGPDQTVLSVFARGGREHPWTLMLTDTLDPPIPARDARTRIRKLVAERIREAYEEDATAMMECRPSRSELIMGDEPAHVTIPAGTRVTGLSCGCTDRGYCQAHAREALASDRVVRVAQPRSTEEIIAALDGRAPTRPVAGLPQPYAHQPGSLDAFPVGQAPGEAAAFSQAMASMAPPRVLRDPKPVEPDPGAALATMDREDRPRSPREFPMYDEKGGYP